MQRKTDTGSATELTARELEVVRLMSEGHSCREAAKRLCRSPRTIENHLRSVYQKWNVRNRVELIRAAEERGLVGQTQAARNPTLTSEMELKGRALELIQRIDARLAVSARQSFFNALCLALADAFETRWAAVTELAPDGGVFDLIALAADGQIGDHLECSIDGTPCGTVMADGELAIWEHLDEAYPGDTALNGWGARSYIGVRLQDPRSGPVGTMCIIHDQPIDQSTLPLQVLRVLAPLAAAELALARALDGVAVSSVEAEA